MTTAHIMQAAAETIIAAALIAGLINENKIAIKEKAFFQKIKNLFKGGHI